MPLFDVYPVNKISIVKGQGSYIWDDQGQQYLDFYGGHAVISVGHTHPHYVARITEQLNRIGFYSNSIEMPLQEELAAKLEKLSGKKDYQLFLCNSGAEANENALKLASFHTGRKKIIAFSQAFHGRTSLAVAATDNPGIVAPVNETDHVVFLPFNDEAALAAYFEQHSKDIAGVIVESIQGVGGINIALDSFLQLIRSLCDQYGAVFIADEVQCGYGRTGKFFALDYAGIHADIYTMAKGMGNGFPVGGIMIAPHIHPKHGMLGTTFGGNHLACAAALAVLEIMEQESLQENAIRMGAYLMQELSAIPGVEHLRGKGLMIGFNAHQDLRKNLLGRHHIFTGAAGPGVVRLLPALNVQQQETDILAEAIKAGLSGVLRDEK